MAGMVTLRSALALLATGVLVAVAFGGTTPGSATEGPRPLLVRLDPAAQDYMRVLGGPPATRSMRSGYVILAPGKSVGRHSTDDYEEVVVVFEGAGTMTITGGPAFALGKGSVAYCPPHTEHDVTNTGTRTLRYLYVVAAAPESAGRSSN